MKEQEYFVLAKFAFAVAFGFALVALPLTIAVNPPTQSPLPMDLVEEQITGEYTDMYIFSDLGDYQITDATGNQIVLRGPITITKVIGVDLYK